MEPWDSLEKSQDSPAPLRHLPEARACLQLLMNLPAVDGKRLQGRDLDLLTFPSPVTMMLDD